MKEGTRMARYEMHETNDNMYIIKKRDTGKIIYETDDHQDCLNYLVELETTDFELDEEGLD